MIKISITTFGALGSLTTSQPIIVEIKQGTKLSEVRHELRQIISKNFPDFSDFNALDKAALADENEILDSSHVFTKDANLAILPPVCGG